MKKKILWGSILIGLSAFSYYIHMNWSMGTHSGHNMPNENQQTMGSTSDMQENEHADHEHMNQSSMSSESKETTYICPMHPQITSNKPGQTCPICGMDLVPMADDDDEVEANSGEDYPNGRASLKLSDKRKQLIGLKTTTVEKIKLFKTVKAPARAAFDPELYTAQAEYQQALKQYERVKDSSLSSVRKNVDRMLSSAKVRLKILGLSNSQINTIKSSSNLSESLLVNRNGGSLWVYADVFEMDLRNIEKGQSVKLSANYLEGAIIAGVVSSTDQVINSNTRTAKVRIQVKKSPVKIRPESYLDANIYVPQGEHLAVPFDAVVDTGEETFVYLSLGDGRFEPRLVQIAFKSGDYVAIADGLKEGDDIVVSGNFLVDSESQLKAVLKGSSGGSGGHIH